MRLIAGNNKERRDTFGDKDFTKLLNLLLGCLRPVGKINYQSLIGSFLNTGKEIAGKKSARNTKTTGGI
jgi:hypothetical protein